MPFGSDEILRRDECSAPARKEPLHASPDYGGRSGKEAASSYPGFAQAAFKGARKAHPGVHMDDGTLAVAHLASMSEAHFSSGAAHGLRISYLREDFPLGTAGALGRLERFRFRQDAGAASRPG